MAIEKLYYLGPEGSYGHKVAKRVFPSQQDVSYESVKMQTDICALVDKTPRCVGIVAIENTINGIVSESVLSIERQSRRRLRVVAEADEQVEFFLYAHPNCDPTLVNTISGHQFALAQTRSNLQKVIQALNLKVNLQFRQR